MARPVLFPIAVVVMLLALVACETAETTPAPGDTPLPPVDTPAPIGDTPAPIGDTPPPAADTPPPAADTPAPQQPTGGRLALVQSRGQLICGVHGTLPGFGFLEQGTGAWSGFDVDFCRAVATAVLGSPEAVEYRPVSADDRSTALQTGEIDVLIRNTTWTVTRDAQWGLFGPTTFYDGQGLMVRADSGASSIDDLGGATICVIAGTTTELNLADAMSAAGHEGNYTTSVFSDTDETYNTYEAGACDAVTSDRSQLVGRRSAMPDPNAHVLLEDVLSKEPLGPVVPFGDDEWFNIVKWTVFVTIEAEELGITQANVEQMRDTSDNPVVQRLLGTDPDGQQGTLLGLDNDWVVDVIAAVGNYGEIFERNVGPNTPLGLDRGLNNLWTQDGLIYAPPYR